MGGKGTYVKLSTIEILKMCLSYACSDGLHIRIVQWKKSDYKLYNSVLI